MTRISVRMSGYKAIQVAWRRDKERASHEITESGTLLPAARGFVRGSLRGEVIDGKRSVGQMVGEKKKGKEQVWQGNTYWP